MVQYDEKGLSQLIQIGILKDQENIFLYLHSTVTLLARFLG